MPSDRTASRWWTTEEIIEVVHDQARKVQFAGDNGVVDTLHDEFDENTPLPEWKISPTLRRAYA